MDGVALCSHCHSPQDWTRHDRTIAPGTYLSGEVWPDVTNAGLIVPPNLTPDPETGLGKWTDDEIARAIREGVDREGHALLRTMPYWRFKNMPDEDLASIVVYLRSLPAVRHVLPKTKLRFPLNYTINNVPAPLTKPVLPRDRSTPEKRGEYLADLGQCYDCHTKAGHPNLGYAGGLVFRGVWGSVATANITPDASGIKYYDERLFKQVMRTGYAGTRPLTYMPWICFRNMTDQDIDDVWSYVRTFKAVQHVVDNTEKPTYCRLCGSVHGYGDRNGAHSQDNFNRSINVLSSALIRSPGMSFRTIKLIIEFSCQWDLPLRRVV